MHVSKITYRDVKYSASIEGGLVTSLRWMNVGILRWIEIEHF